MSAEAKWRILWRDAIAPRLSTKALTALLAGIDSDDENLIRTHTVWPLEFHEDAGMVPRRRLDIPATGGCAIGYALAREQPRTVGEVQALAGAIMNACDALFPCSWPQFTAFFDHGWDNMENRHLLWPEVKARLREEVVASWDARVEATLESLS